MKNTLNQATFRVLIYKNRLGTYTSICYETGFVDESETMAEAFAHVENGTAALIQTIKDKHLSEAALNQKPSMKYRAIFYILPLIAACAKWLEISFFTKPLSPRLFSNPV